MLDSQGRSLLRFLHVSRQHYYRFSHTHTPQPPDATLTPPLALRDATHLLQEIIGVYTSSLVDAQDRADDFETVLDKSLSPALEMCERMGEMRTSDAWDRDVFMINCIGYLQVSLWRGLSGERRSHTQLMVENSLEEYPHTEERMAQLGERIGKHVESMTFEHVSRPPRRVPDIVLMMAARQVARRVRSRANHADDSDSTRRCESSLTSLSLSRTRARAKFPRHPSRESRKRARKPLRPP